MRVLTDYERGFLEGAIDAEGMLTLRRLKSTRYKVGHQFAVMGSIDNTNIEFLQKIKLLIGDGSICLHQRYSNKNYKDSYRYQFTRSTLRWMLPQLKLIVKEKQRLIVLEALQMVNGHKGLGNALGEERTIRLELLVNEIRSLNNRGLNAAWNREKK